MISRRHCAVWLPALVLLGMAGCASPPQAAGTAEVSQGPWSGRLALQVKDNASQSFAAMFELKGSARTGELALTSPLGNTLAVLGWAPGSATLRSNGRTQQFGSVDELVARATGSALPVQALFDWLRGVDTPVPGWRPDLSQLAQGRLAALRIEPAPEADLRVILDR
jgi:outer membrane lipoprotein LolB